MTDDEYAKEKRNLEKFLIPLKDALLNEWKIKHVFNRERYDTDRGRMADTSPLWEYKTATINWYMPAIAEFCPEQSDVFNLVVHEFVHCIIDPIAPESDSVSDEKRAIVEFVTQNLTDSIERMFTNPNMFHEYDAKLKREERAARRKKSK